MLVARFLLELGQGASFLCFSVGIVERMLEDDVRFFFLFSQYIDPMELLKKWEGSRKLLVKRGCKLVTQLLKTVK